MEDSKKKSERMKGIMNPFFGKRHSLETRKKIKEKRAKQTPTFLGKHHSDETRKKISENKRNSSITRRKENHPHWKGGHAKCKDCGIELGRYKANYCPKCVVPHLRGEKHPNWKGGLTPLMLTIRHCFKYRQWRSDVFTRDDFRCQNCGVKGGYVEADHFPKKFAEIFYEFKIKSIDEALTCEIFWDINNGRTLCPECHDKTKNKK